MKVFFWGTGLFAAVFLLHVAAWRVARPAAARRSLFPIFLGALPVTLGLAAALAPVHPGLRPLLPADAGEYLLLAAFYGSISLAYLALYVALEGDSPTLAVIRAVSRAGAGGMDPAELRRGMLHNRHVLSRLECLVTDGMARRDGDRYHITAKGRRLLGYYDAYDRAAGLGHDATV